MISGEDNHSVLQARERYKKQRERARLAIEQERAGGQSGNHEGGGSTVEGTIEGGYTVESDEKHDRDDAEDSNFATESLK